jgi:WhiB family redox-sensing transcriptional regulator
VIEMDWRDAAECQYEDPELFFPMSPSKVAEAKAVCARCPVWRSCLGYAFATGQDAGIWGGMTEEERRRELRRRFRARTRPRGASEELEPLTERGDRRGA